MKEYWNINELSEYLGIKKSTLYAMVTRGEIPNYKIGHLIRFRKNEIDQWMESHKREGIDIDKRINQILKPQSEPKIDIDGIIKRTVDTFKVKKYSTKCGKPGQIRGLERR
jgi:excisionase family DNA binding protein